VKRVHARVRTEGAVEPAEHIGSQMGRDRRPEGQQAAWRHGSDGTEPCYDPFSTVVATLPIIGNYRE
jgi:hypothetical protein